MSTPSWVMSTFHQTRLSRAVKGIPVVKKMAWTWWMRQQRIAFFEAFRQLGQPNSDFTHATVPALDFAPSRTGDAFADFMRANSTSPKFYSLGYQDVYGPICDQIEGPSVRILEIGIGVNDPSVPSGMPASHQPGASLRGWLKRFPAATVHGADVDLRALVTDGTYSVHYVDQRSNESLGALADDLGPGFDLIVDDGLHTAEANALTATNLLPLLRPGGFLVVEDILPQYWEFWDSLLLDLPPAFSLRFIRGTELRSGANSGIAVFHRNA